MIDYVDARLKLWGRWSFERFDGGSGLCAGRDMHGSARYCSMPLIREDCIITESAVDWLSARHAPLALMVRLHYREGSAYTAQHCAQLAGVSRRAFYLGLDRAHLEILGYLTEREMPRFRATPRGLIPVIQA